MKKISKKIALLCVIILILATFCSCRPSNYSKHFDTTFLFDVNWMIGKNSNEIQKRYGVFDNNNIALQEKTYIDAVGMYLTGKGVSDLSFKLFLRPVNDEYIYIYFDSNGIAYKVETRVEIFD